MYFETFIKATNDLHLNPPINSNNFTRKIVELSVSPCLKSAK
ncbi:hypothetical protein [Methylomonas fluvii]|nr:hypothetical protein [Methylomonas fluvii]